MGRKHSKKEVAEVIEYAIKNGWSFVPPEGHAFGILRCPTNKKCRNGHYCQLSVYSTPKSSLNHARRIKDAIDNCMSKGSV